MFCIYVKLQNQHCDFLRCVITSRCLICGDVEFYISENVVLLFIAVELGSYFYTFALISISVSR